MNARQIILSRRSVRQYTEQAVSDEDIHIMLEAAMAAPSAGNAQPWEFLVIDDKDVLQTVSTLSPYMGMARNAPLAILVCGNLEREKYPGFWVQDCSAAIQNLMLAARSLELGSVWTGIYPVEERVAGFCMEFKLPEHIVPLGLIVIGHPEKGVAANKEEQRYNAERVHRNTW